MAVATTVHDSGLIAVIQQAFESVSSCSMRIIAAGSGRGLELVRRGDVDGAITHLPEAEQQYIQDGFAASDTEFMANRFILVGPAEDPAAATSLDFAGAFAAIAHAQHPFVSRQDDSGTYHAEQKIWSAAGKDSTKFGNWYIRAGSNMGQTLLLADEMRAYTLSDSATYAIFAHERKLRLHKLQTEDDLGNRYSLITAKQPHNNCISEFASWLTSANGAAAIASLNADSTQLFHPSRP